MLSPADTKKKKENYEKRINESKKCIKIEVLHSFGRIGGKTICQVRDRTAGTGGMEREKGPK